MIKDKSMFSYKTHIKLYQTDAAGRLFFGHQFFLIHDAEEAFLNEIGLGTNFIIEKSDYIFPIIHTEADYLCPLKNGENITITLEVDKIGHSSITELFTIYNADTIVAGKVKLVHVCVEKKSGEKSGIPEFVLEKITPYLKS